MSIVVSELLLTGIGNVIIRLRSSRWG